MGIAFGQGFYALVNLSKEKQQFLQNIDKKEDFRAFKSEYFILKSEDTQAQLRQTFGVTPTQIQFLGNLHSQLFVIKPDHPKIRVSLNIQLPFNCSLFLPQYSYSVLSCHWPLASSLLETQHQLSRALPDFYLELLYQKPLSFPAQVFKKPKDGGKHQDEQIEKLLGQVSETYLTGVVEFLTGEATESNITTRNSFSTDIAMATDYIVEEFRRLGLSTSLDHYEEGWAPNVYGDKVGLEPQKVIYVGAHYDSRSRDRMSPTDPAPGGNDDGSGAAMVMQIAKILADPSVEFRYTLRFALWAGEEQGRVGSRAAAARLVQDGRVGDIIAVLQADMIGHRFEGEPALLVLAETCCDMELTTLMLETAQKFVPQLTFPGYADGCATDSASFYEIGVPATAYYENIPILDPFYHDAGDISRREDYDYEQISWITQASLAGTCVLAELLNVTD
eukprot:Lithocolla_globosa_v1_NODE_1394_length_2613_cov_4.775039.p1 type:complete len:448 gc:universal NODE_1394_length_2613_cov_4.775039:1402-59(-)